MKKIINSYALTHRRNALIILLILLMTLAAFFQNAATSKTSAATTIVSGSVYVLRNKCGDKALDVSSASSANGANVQQYTYVGNANQQWKIEATDSGYYKLTAQHSGKSLDISGAATTRGSNVQQYTYHGGVNQQWKITDAGDGYWKLSPRNASGQALDVSNSSTENGANVQIWDDNGSCAQRWSLERIGGGTTPTTRLTAINSGGNQNGDFLADRSVNGGATYATDNAVSTAGVANAAPAGVYQSERYGEFTYTINSLTPNSAYTVRLHFAEIYFNGAGQRVFNVKINGNQVLENFDVFAAAGGKNKAVVKEFAANATASGQITIQTQSITDNAKLSGLEVLSSSPTTPTPIPTTPTPVPPTPTPIPPTPTPVPPTPPSSSYSIVTSSFLGDSGNSDSVRGSAVLSDGTIVLAANIGNKNPSNVSPILLNGASSTSGGAIIRLNPEGQVVLSVTRLANEVDDLAIDTSDNIYVAAWNRGVVKLNSMANTLVWAKSVSGNVGRIDVGRDGTVAALATTNSSPVADNPDGTVYVYNSSGSQISTFAGKNFTLDICVDGTSKTIITIGFRNAYVNGPASGLPNGAPVQIAYLRGSSYTGSVKYTDYDWSDSPSSSNFINKPENNMADTRGLRCAMGADGKLYAAFMSAGGNHIFRYSPTSITTRSSVVGGDAFQTFNNTRAEHKTIFGRFDPSNGQLLLMQQIVNRTSSGDPNTIWMRRGAIAADASGQVYLGGECNSGLPMPPNPRYSPKTGEKTFNPFPDTTTGGAWLMVMSSDFKTRKFVTRLATGVSDKDHPTSTNAIAVRTFSNGTRKIVFGGTTTFPASVYVKNAIEITPNGGSQDGWFAVTGSN